MTKTFGRNPNNDIVINLPDISGDHARITLIDNDSFLVEDLDSTNGTYVNGYRIKKTRTSLQDEVRLSEKTIIDIRKLFGISLPEQPVKSNPNDFSVEFNTLKKVWENYQKDRIAITKKFQFRMSVVRAGIIVAPLIIWEILHAVYINKLEDTDPAAFRYWQNKYLLFSVLGSSIGVLATGSSSPMEKLSQLDEDFRVKYVCPNPSCRTQLGNIPWLSYANQGKCYKCNAIYVKK